MTIASLYVARERRAPERYDLGSTLCLNVLDLLPEGAIEVVECTPPIAECPTWLIGTPTVHVHSTEDVHRGYAALSALQRLAVEQASKAPAKASAKAPAKVPEQPAEDASVWEMTPDADDEDDVMERKLTREDMDRVMQRRREAS